MTPLLFTPCQIGPVTLPNRIVVAPMCQYSANDGVASDWHLQHLMNLAMSGAGLVVVEATAVERIGRITHGCLGLYSDACEQVLARTVAAARAVALPGTKFGVQLAHAGRKAASRLPWHGGGPLRAGEDPWPTVGPSPIPFGPGCSVPEELDEAGIERIVQAFARAAGRAVRAGFDAIELHMAHGYLMHSFVSPVANHRTDAYGGSRERRHALPLRIARAVLDAVPSHVAVGTRITGTDWLAEGLGVADAIALADDLKAAGLAFACVSSGGVAADVAVPTGPLYQVPLARGVREATGIVTRAVGLIRTPHEAESVLQNGDADLVALGRPFLDDPRWGWHAADALGVDLPRPPQYMRGVRAGGRVPEGRKN